MSKIVASSRPKHAKQNGVARRAEMDRLVEITLAGVAGASLAPISEERARIVVEEAYRLAAAVVSYRDARAAR